MRRKIIAYGHPLLKQTCTPIDRTYPELKPLISNMWKTMLYANGCGLAAPQIGVPLHLFIIDSASVFVSLDKAGQQKLFAKGDREIKEPFINVRITKYSEEIREDEERCLSIPRIYPKIKRSRRIEVVYCNKNFEKGILYLDYLHPLKKSS